MKRYNLSLTMTHTSEELEEVGQGHLTEKEIQEFMEDEFNQLVFNADFYSTEFKVEEI